MYKNNYHIHRDFEKGKISEKDFIAQMLEYLEHCIDEETFCKYWSDIFSFNDDVIALLPVLKKELQTLSCFKHKLNSQKIWLSELRILKNV